MRKRGNQTAPVSSPINEDCHDIGSLTGIKDEIIELLEFDMLDLWMQDNHYILSGYRAMSNSYRKSLSSIGRLHNETVNIWTHLLPGMLLLACFLYFAIRSMIGVDRRALSALLRSSGYNSATSNDWVVLSVFAVGALTMFSASWFYHTVSNHSVTVSKYWNKFDYVGIVCMIIGSFVPSVYYGHYCKPKHIKNYLLMLGSLGLATFFFTILDRFRTPAWRPYRAGLFISLGLSAVFPVFGAIIRDGFDKVDNEMSLRYVIVQGALYISGAVIYACRIPEKWYPRTFDLVGASHQIFHVCVVLAGITHALGVMKAFDYRHRVLHGTCP